MARGRLEPRPDILCQNLCASPVKEKSHSPGAGLGLCLTRVIPACTPRPGAESRKGGKIKGDKDLAGGLGVVLMGEQWLVLRSGDTRATSSTALRIWGETAWGLHPAPAPSQSIEEASAHSPAPSETPQDPLLTVSTVGPCFPRTALSSA